MENTSIEKIKINKAELVLINNLKDNYDKKKKETTEKIFNDILKSVKYLNK
tara:strand:+ start:659 stop:811 length:153 start_codon:yes stop_codon:yes gene_type:complete